MKNENKFKVAIIESVHDAFLSKVEQVEGELNAIMGEICASQIDVPDELTLLTPVYIENVVEGGKADFFSHTSFIPVHLKDSTKKSFDDEKQRLKELATRLQNALGQIPCKVRKDDETKWWYFDDTEVEREAKKIATFTIEGEDYTYLCILQDIAKQMQAAREWENAHGFRNFVGTDEVLPCTSGGVITNGWGYLMSEGGRFEMSAETYINYLNRGSLGKI